MTGRQPEPPLAHESKAGDEGARDDAQDTGEAADESVAAKRSEDDLGADAVATGRSWLVDAADLLAQPDPGPTPWLVEDLIVEAALVACVGRWKTTKSYGLLHVCISIATGHPAFGALDVPEPGPVVFCNEESGLTALWRRLDALARGNAIDPEELRGRLMVAANARIKLDDQAWRLIFEQAASKASGSPTAARFSASASSRATSC